MSWGTNVCRRRSPNCAWSDQNRGICCTYQIYSSVDYMVEPHVFFTKANHSVSGWQQQVVKEFQYLWVLLNSTLTFEAHIKKVCKTLGFNLSNIQLRQLPCMSTPWFSHTLNYCITSWSGKPFNLQSTWITIQTGGQVIRQEAKTLSPLHNTEETTF